MAQTGPDLQMEIFVRRQLTLQMVGIGWTQGRISLEVLTSRDHPRGTRWKTGEAGACGSNFFSTFGAGGRTFMNDWEVNKVNELYVQIDQLKQKNNALEDQMFQLRQAMPVFDRLERMEHLLEQLLSRSEPPENS